MKKIILSIILFTGLIGFAQEDILFTFANSEVTTEGGDSFYEVDVMIQTDNTATGSFKLGSGQLYFNYNTAAFGTNVFANSRFEVTHDDSYIAGQNIDAGGADIYLDQTLNDNETNRVSWPFKQSFSSSTFADDNVTPTPKELCHLKFKFVDNTKLPMLEFEDGATFDNQFFTACGGVAGSPPFIFANCGSLPGIQIVNDSFDSGGATLSDGQIVSEVDFNVYPNPTKGLINIDINKESSYALVDMLGRVVESGAFKAGNNEMYLRDYDSGVYFIKIEKEGKTYSKRIILD